MTKRALQDRERAVFCLDLLNACINSDTVRSIPNQEKRAKIIEGLRASLKYYQTLGKQFETWATYELCLLVERSSSVHNARESLKQRILAETANVNQTPDSNTGVRSSEYQALEDYIGGR